MKLNLPIFFSDVYEWTKKIPVVPTENIDRFFNIDFEMSKVSQCHVTVLHFKEKKPQEKREKVI